MQKINRRSLRNALETIDQLIISLNDQQQKLILKNHNNLIKRLTQKNNGKFCVCTLNMISRNISLLS